MTAYFRTGLAISSIIFDPRHNIIFGNGNQR